MDRIAIPIIITLALAAFLAPPSPVGASRASAALVSPMIMHAFDTTVGVEFSGTVAFFTAPAGAGEPAGSYKAIISWGDSTKSDGTITGGPTSYVLLPPQARRSSWC